MRLARSRLRSLAPLGAFLLLVAAGSAAALQEPSEPAAGPSSAARPNEPLLRGEIVDPVVCRADPSKSYALYLPSAYTPERKWSVLFVLDARGRGRQVAERFQAAAERFGWVVASSNDSASDAGWGRIRDPAAALFADVPERVAMDPARFYLAGFSGTARAATAIGANAEGGIAGVIAVGAGLRDGLDPASLPYALFAAAGNEDFNYLEVDALAETLAGTAVEHRIETFDGGHEWVPEALAAEALGFFELSAMAAGRRSSNLELAVELASSWLATAAARERDGDAVGALRLYRSAAAGLAALEVEPQTEVAALRAEAEDAVGRLTGSEELKRAEAERRRVEVWEEDRRREAERVIVTLGRLDTLLMPGVKARGEDLIRDLQEIAEGAEEPVARRHAAGRVLALLNAYAGFYLPRDLLASEAYGRAEAALELAVLIRPENAVYWYNMACARARRGRDKKALDALESAVDAGFTDARHIATDADLESLRESDRFRRLVASLDAGDPPQAE